MEEQLNGTVTKVYTFGHDLISQDQRDGSGSFAASFYGYDGHGSVRLLTNELGQPTDSYTYDAFGELIHKTGATANEYLYCGERCSGGLGLYYLRARFMSTNYGRFWNMDVYEGRLESAGSLHKFCYAQGDAVSYTDPSGNEIETSAGLKGMMAHALFYFYCVTQGIPRWFDEEIGTSLQLPMDAPNRDLRPDVVDTTGKRWFELKPVTHRSSKTLMVDGYRGLGGTSQQLERYRSVMSGHGYSPGFSFDLVPGRRFIGITYDNMLRPLLTFIEPADPITSIAGGRHDTRGLIYYWFRRLRPDEILEDETIPVVFMAAGAKQIMLRSSASSAASIASQLSGKVMKGVWITQKSREAQINATRARAELSATTREL